MTESVLCRYDRRLSQDERENILDGQAPDTLAEEIVTRADGTEIGLAALDSLMDTAMRGCDDGPWRDDRTLIDRWLAPRVHYALPISRQIAADRRVWEWLALRYHNHTYWRWVNLEFPALPENRWYGPVNKQVLARLWWGAELFRDGADYRPVERAFVRQDLINSYLHRPLVRCRSLALGILDVVAPAVDPLTRSSGQVNDLARVLNLATAGAPPEHETDLQHDDWAAFEAWAACDGEVPVDWDPLPTGPPAVDTTERSREGGRDIALRGWAFATHGAS